jgi:hypothetical protein
MGKMPVLKRIKYLQANYNKLSMRDPLIRLFRKLEYRNIVWTSLVAIAINGIFVIGLGYLVSTLYKNAGYQFVDITDSRELPIVVFVFLIFIPIIWSFYVWQPRAIQNIFLELSNNGVIGFREQTASLDAFIDKRVNAPCDQIHNFLIALLFTIGNIAIWFGANSANDPFLFGQSAKWWSINPILLWLFWIPLVFVNVYMISWIIIRQVIAISALTHLYRSATISMKALHPDGCNGLAPVGDYAMRITSMAVLFGFWVAFWIVSPLLFGLPLGLKADTILLLLAYIIAVPALLIPPVWATHSAMSRIKADALESIAVQIRKVFSESNLEDAAQSISLVGNLRTKYQFVDMDYRTWPFRLSAFRGFIITAVTPLLSTAASVLLERLLT